MGSYLIRSSREVSSAFARAINFDNFISSFCIWRIVLSVATGIPASLASRSTDHSFSFRLRSMFLTILSISFISSTLHHSLTRINILARINLYKLL